MCPCCGNSEVREVSSRQTRFLMSGIFILQGRNRDVWTFLSSHCVTKMFWFQLCSYCKNTLLLKTALVFLVDKCPIVFFVAAAYFQ